MRNRQQMSENKYNLTWVDAMRGWAILGVLMVHVGINENATVFLKTIIANGARGVQLFFLMSAFTMFYTYKRHFKEERKYVGNFFIRRFFRIAPLYYLAIIWYLWLNGTEPNYWTGYIQSITGFNIVSNFLFIHGLYPYYINSLVPGGWSITVEMMFYLFIPGLFLKIKNLKQAVGLLAVFLFIRKALNMLLFNTLNIEPLRLLNEYAFLYLPGQLPIFALGIILYFLFENQYDLKDNWKLLFITTILCLTSSWVVRISFFFVVIIILCNKYKWLFLQNRAVCFIGKISYSMYLIHFTVLNFYPRVDVGSIFNFNNIIGLFFLKG